MKESLRHIDNRIVFRETFQDEFNVRRNGGIPTDVTFQNGKGSFNGTTSKILINKISLNFISSVRIKVSNIIDSIGDILSYRGVVRIFTDNNDIIKASFYDGGFSSILSSITTIGDIDEIIITWNGTNCYLYINGILEDSDSIGDMAFSDFPTRDSYIGVTYLGSSGFYSGSVDLLENYNEALTTSEVSNLYNNSTYHELPNKIEEQLNNNLAVNGGASDTTDWLNPTDGFAEYWKSGLSGSFPMIASIVTGNGFVGNAQRVEENNGIDYTAFTTSSGVLTAYKKYKFTGKYRTNTTNLKVTNSSGITLSTMTLPQNTGNASNFSLYVYIDATTSWRWNAIGIDGWFEFDELKIQEVIEGTGIEKILDVASFGGVLKDKMGNTLTPTDVEIKKIGSNVYSPDFNGSSSKIDAGNFDDLTGDITVMAWINAKNLGGGGEGRIVDNRSMTLKLADFAGDTFLISSDGATFTKSASGAVLFNKYQFIAFTRTSLGVVNIYVDSVISGAINQSSGTPMVGIENIHIGNIAGQTRTFDGKIPRTVIYKGLLTLEQITQFYSNTRKDYNV